MPKIIHTIPTSEEHDITLSLDNNKVAIYTAGCFSAHYSGAVKRAGNREGYLNALLYLKTLADQRGALETPPNCNLVSEPHKGIFVWHGHRIRLVESITGHLNLVCVDKEGDPIAGQKLLGFGSDRVKLHDSIYAAGDLPVDKSNKLIVE